MPRIVEILGAQQPQRRRIAEILPQEDPSAFESLKRGTSRSLGQQKELIQGAPGLIQTMGQARTTPETFMRGLGRIRDIATGLPEAIPQIANEIVGGEEGREVPFLERLAFIGTDLLSGGAVLKGLKTAGRAAGVVRKASKAADVAQPARRLMLPEKTPSTLAAERTGLQEMADRAAGLAADASRPPIRPPGQVVPGAASASPIDEAIRGALDDLRAPAPGFAGAPPSTVSLPPGLPQPEVSISPTAARIARRPPQPPSQQLPLPLEGVSSPAVPEAASRVLKASREGVIPMTSKKSAAEVMASRAGEGGSSGAMHFRTKRAEQMLREKRTVGLRQLLDEGAARGLGPEEVAQAVVNVSKSDAGFAHQNLMATIAGAGAGATAGAALFQDDPDAFLGGTILMGIGGAKLFPKLLNFAAMEPGRARQLFASAGRAIQGLRAELALTGMAAPKNIASAIGAPVTAGIEKASLAPAREALRIPTNARNFLKGFRDPIDVGLSTGVPRGKARIFSRIISGIDFQAEEALKRAGLTQAESDRILLKTSMGELIGHKNALRQALESPIGRAAVLFQRTPMNVFVRALTEPSDLFRRIPGTTLGEQTRRRALTAGATGAGVAGGLFTEDMDPYSRVLVMGLMAAFLGPRAGAFTIGAGATGAAEAAGGVSPFPEFGFDAQAALGSIVEPAGVRLVSKLTEPPKRTRRRQRRRSRS